MSKTQPFPSTYDGLLQLVERLRGQDGCPWDREQTRDSMRPLFLEECYELIEAIEESDDKKLVEELGDVLFHLAFQVHLGGETAEFTEDQVFGSVIEKLVRRHPHVFGDVSVADAKEAKANWDAIKREERTGTETSILDGVPKHMPALSYAQEVQERAARSGFDWDALGGVLDKVREELNELDEARSDSEREMEVGDLLFSLVNVARWLGIDAEGALRHANARFFRRYSTVEELSRKRDLSLMDLPLDKKEALWQESKRMGD